MNVGELFVKIAIDTKAFETGLAEIEAKLKAIGGSLSGFKIDFSSVKGLSDISAASNELKQALASAIPVSQQLKQRLQEQQTQYGILSSALAETATKYGATSKQAQSQELALQKLSNSINQTKAALDTAVAAEQKNAQATDQVADAAQKAAAAEDTLSAKTKQVGADMAATSGHAQSFGARIKDALTFAAGNLLADAIRATGQAFIGTISTAADFEAALSGVSAVAGGLATGDLEALRAKALEIGASTSLSASQAVSAFEALVANGIDPTAASFNTIADSTVALAEATGADLTTAANVATDVIQNFAGAGNDLNAVINGITGVTVAGKFGINDYRLALSNGGVAAAGYGVSLSDFNTVIAATSSAFASGQTAGTAFRTFVERLTPSTETAKKAMMELGLITEDGANAFYNLDGSLKGMQEIFGIVEQAFGGLSEEARTAKAELIFGAEGANMLTAAMRVGADGFAEYEAGIAKINAADQAAERLNNFKGAIEQLKGSLETLAIVIGTPIINALTPLIQMLGSAVGGFTRFAQAVLGASNPVQFLIAKVNSILPGFAQVASQAGAWGSAIVNSFTAGIYAAFGPLVRALQQIGMVIRSWLQPHSPPKIVPDLDKYGIEAGQMYVDAFGQSDPVPGMQTLGGKLKGALFGLTDRLSADAAQTGTEIVAAVIEPFSSADFSALDRLSGAIQETLKGMVDAGKATIGEEGIIPAVMGSQEAIQAAISQFNEFGQVSEEAIQLVTSAAGDAGPAVEGLVRAYFDLEVASRAVAEAQQELNDVTQEYAEKVGPLQDQLDDVKARQQQIRDQEKLADLNKILADDKASEADKEQARLEIEEMRIRQQIDSIEKERDIAVDAAQTKLDAAKENEAVAKENYATQQAQLDFYNNQNGLIAQQTQLLQRLAEEAARAAEAAAKAAAGGSAGGGAGGGLGGLGGGISIPELPPPPDASAYTAPLGEIESAITDNTNAYLAMKDAQGEAAMNAQQSLPPLSPLMQGISNTLTILQQAFTNVATTIQSIVNPALTYVGSLIASTINPALAFFKTNVDTAFAGSAPIIAQFKMLMGEMGAVFDQIKPALTGLIAIIGGGLVGAIVGVIGFLTGALPGAFMFVEGVIQTVRGVFELIVGTVVNLGIAFSKVLAGDIPGAATALQEAWSSFTTGLTNITSGLLTAVLGIFASLAGGISGLFESIYGFVTGKWTNLTSTITGQAQQLKDNVIKAAGDLYTGFIKWIGDLYTGAVQWFTDLYNELVGGSIVPEMVTAIIEEITTLKDDFIQLVTDLYTTALQWFNDLKTDALEAITNLATEIGNLATTFLNEAKAIGTEIINGIIQGVTQAASNLYNAIKGVVKRAIGAAEEEGDIGSPSGETMRRVGVPLVQGIVAGIEDQIPQLEAAAANLTNIFIKDAQTRIVELKKLYAEMVAEIAKGTLALNKMRIDTESQIEALFDTSATDALEKAMSDFDAKIKVIDTDTSVSEVEKELQTIWAEYNKVQDEIQAKEIESTDRAFEIQQERAQNEIDTNAKIAERRKKLAETLEKFNPDNPENLEKINAARQEFDRDVAERRKKLAEQLTKYAADETNPALIKERNELIKTADDDILEMKRKLNEKLAAFDPNNPKTVRERAAVVKDAEEDIANIRLSLNEKNNKLSLEQHMLEQELIRLRQEAAEKETNTTARDKELQDQRNRIALEQERARAALIAEKERAKAALTAAEAEQKAIANKAAEQIKALDAELKGIANAKVAAQVYEKRKAQIIALAKLDQDIAYFKAKGDQKEVDKLLRIRKLTEENAQIENALLQEDIEKSNAETAEKLEAAKELAKQIESVFRAQSFDGIGTSVAQGIARGLQENMRLVSEALTTGMKDAIAKLKQQLGIKSPSKVSGNEIGLPFVQGIAERVIAGKEMLAQAATRAVDGLNVRPPMPAMALSPTTLSGLPSGLTGQAMGYGDTFNISIDLRGSNLARTEVEAILDQRLDRIARIAKGIKK